MKAIVIVSILAITGLAQADHYSNKEIVSCRVTKMVNYYFDEGLSPHEYPDVEVSVSPTGENTMGVGSLIPFEKTGGYTVTVKRNGHDDRVVIAKSKDGTVYTLKVEYRTRLARATLKVQEPHDKKAGTIAYLLCDTGIF